MEIRKATTADLDRVMDIYAYARSFMAEHGNPTQWGPTNWPPVWLIEKDIEKGCCHVCIHEGKIVGVFYYEEGTHTDPCYDVIEEGSWQGSEDYAVVHRIASDGSVKGIGAFCINWAFAQSGNLRMDTHGDNKVMQNLLTKIGFIKRGIIHVEEDNYPRLAYERLQ